MKHLTEDQLKNVNTLIEWLKSPQAKSEFDMNTWCTETEDCGTVMCMGGFIQSHIMKSIPADFMQQDYKGAGALIGMDEEQADYAFYPEDSDDFKNLDVSYADITPEIATTFMERWRDLGLLDWEESFYANGWQL